MEPGRAPGRSQAGPDPHGGSPDALVGQGAPSLNLLNFDREGLAAYCEQLGEKRFRATQLFRWIHRAGASEFAQMTDLAGQPAQITAIEFAVGIAEHQRRLGEQ